LSTGDYINIEKEIDFGEITCFYEHECVCISFVMRFNKENNLIEI